MSVYLIEISETLIEVNGKTWERTLMFGKPTFVNTSGEDATEEEKQEVLDYMIKKGL